MNEINPVHPDLPNDGGPNATSFTQHPGPEPEVRRASLRDALVVLFYHAKLLRSCVLLGCLLGAAGAITAHTYFTADALVLVMVGAESTSAQDVAGMTPTVVSVDGLKLVQSELQIIHIDQVLRTAVLQIGPGLIYPSLAKPRWFGLRPARADAVQVGEAVQKLHADLRVEVEPGSSVIRLAFTHQDRTVAERVVEAVLNEYLAQRRSIYSSSNSLFLDRELERYKASLSSVDSQIEDLKTRYDVLDMAQDIVLATNRLDGVVQRQNQVRERRVAVETEVVAVRANLATQPETVLDFKETTNNTGNDEARNTLVKLTQERTYLISQFNPHWPAIAEIDKKIASARAQMGPQERNLYFSERQIRNPALEVLNNRLASLEVEDKALGEQLSELDGQYKEAEKRVKSLREAEGKLHNLQLTRDVTESVYRQLAQREPALVFQSNVIDERNANLRVVQPPTVPTIGRSMAITYLVGGLFLGLLSGGAATAIATLSRHVYITPNEAERELGMPAVAVFDHSTGKGEIDREPAMAALAALLQDVTVDGRRLTSLQIMGTADGDERPGLAQLLATEIAVGHERKTLILDLEGDGSAYSAALGLAESVPAPSGRLPLSVVATKLPRVWIGRDVTQSVLGDWRASVGGLHLALEELQREFSMLLLVAPGDLAKHAVRRLVGIVDANVLVIRAEHSRAPVVMQLRDAVKAAGGNMLGFIFVGRKYYIPAWIYRWL